MGFLDRLFGGKKKDEQDVVEQAAADAECPHTALVAQWETADDMGKDDKITGYRCEGCGATFSREEGDRLRAAEDDRLKALEVNKEG